ncbi:MAG: hypothetical protein KBG47_00550 [Bacteroidia bacterium]|jgi:uncharacterized membrane protein|nr:hypothetical protein [Sphingobacteriaceae bacterium]MBP9067964.1 hypothetical protein [Bacteroidia bacterium]
MKEQEPSKETLEQWHKDPSNWVWGMFYYNPKDKRLLPPKRIRAMGWTVNFANPTSVFILIGILVLTAVVVAIDNK